jgi:hypothetical protein
MPFAGADKTYESTWYACLVDRDETVSTVSMNFT